jgi:hypothetical protein
MTEEIDLEFTKPNIQIEIETKPSSLTKAEFSLLQNNFPFKQWRKKQFILEEGCIVIQNNENDKKKTTISIGSDTFLHGGKVGRNLNKKYRFKLVNKKDCYIFETDSIIHFNEWKEAFKNMDIPCFDNWSRNYFFKKNSSDAVNSKPPSGLFACFGAFFGEENTEMFQSLESQNDQIEITTHGKF